MQAVVQIPLKVASEPAKNSTNTMVQAGNGLKYWV